MTPELAERTFDDAYPAVPETAHFGFYDLAELSGLYSPEQLRLIADLIEQLRPHRGA